MNPIEEIRKIRPWQRIAVMKHAGTDQLYLSVTDHEKGEKLIEENADFVGWLTDRKEVEVDLGDAVMPPPARKTQDKTQDKLLGITHYVCGEEVEE